MIDAQRSEKARELAQRIYDYNTEERNSFLESIIAQSRPKELHLDHWRYDVHCALINHYKDFRELFGRNVEEATALAYMKVFEEILYGRIHSQTIRPRSRYLRANNHSVRQKT